MSNENALAKTRDQLIRKRGVIKSKLTSFKNLLVELKETQELPKLRAHLERLESTFSKLEEYTEALQEIDPDRDYYAEQELMEQDYTNLRAEAYTIQDRVAEAAASAHSAAHSQMSPHPFTPQSTLTRLPEQSLPKFSGQYEEWLSFQDDFQSTVGRRPGLSETEKLKYLRSCLSGEPERLVRQFETTDEGYRSAWTLLKKMFEDKGRIRERHVTAMFNMQPLQRESARELSELINTAELHRSALKSLSEDTFSTMSLCLVLSKLDKTTRKHWKMSLKEGQLPDYDDLIAFLRRMVLSSDEPSISLKDSRSNEQNKSRNIAQNNHSGRGANSNRCFMTTANNTCPICQNQHGLFQCNKFKGLSPKAKYKAASQAALCINCLRPGHGIKQCMSTFACRICQKRHHTLLHFSEPSASSSDGNESIETKIATA